MKLAERVGLRPMLPSDAPLLAEIFEASIEDLTEEDYSADQRAAWAGVAETPRFVARLQDALTLVATIEGAPVGFIALEGASEIAMLYVHPSVARQGVASLLYAAIETLAGSRGAKLLSVDASDTAKPFFDAKGFEAKSRQTVGVGDVWLGNTRMEKKLEP